MMERKRTLLRALLACALAASVVAAYYESFVTRTIEVVNTEQGDEPSE